MHLWGCINWKNKTLNQAWNGKLYYKSYKAQFIDSPKCSLSLKIEIFKNII